MKLLLDDMNLDWSQPDERPRGREDAVWYTFSGSNSDPVVSVSKGDRQVLICADGEMRVLVYNEIGKPEAGHDIIRYCEDFDEYGLSDDADIVSAFDKGRIEWGDNPWFDLYIENGETQESDHLDCVCHTLSEAIACAAKIINDDKEWTK